MEKEHSELQQHITRTDWWCENLGHWRATITAAEVTSSLLRRLSSDRATRLADASKNPSFVAGYGRRRRYGGLLQRVRLSRRGRGDGQQSLERPEETD